MKKGLHRFFDATPRDVGTGSKRKSKEGGVSTESKRKAFKPSSSTSLEQESTIINTPQKGLYKITPEAVYERDKYLARTPAEVHTMLTRYGVAVVPDVLTRAEAASAFDDMIQCLERMYDGFVFKDPSTWALLRRVSYCKHGMLFQHMGIGWAQFAVALRQKPSVATLFAELWTLVTGTPVTINDLFSSADGIAFGATRAGDRGGFHGKDWMHLDQAAGDTVVSIQGGLNLVETKTGDAAFHFLESSHLHFDEFFKRLADPKKSARFTLLQSQRQIDFFVSERSCMPKCLATLPGDLYLWSSKTVHSGRPPLRQASPAPSRAAFLRGVVYVSMQPKRFATPADVKRKVRAYNELRTTAHNAARGVTLFQQSPRTYGHVVDSVLRPIVEKPALSTLGRSLFAVDSV
jgi:hypothetical protein